MQENKKNQTNTHHILRTQKFLEVKYSLYESFFDSFYALYRGLGVTRNLEKPSQLNRECIDNRHSLKNYKRSRDQRVLPTLELTSETSKIYLSTQKIIKTKKTQTQLRCLLDSPYIVFVEKTKEKLKQCTQAERFECSAFCFFPPCFIEVTIQKLESHGSSQSILDHNCFCSLFQKKCRKTKPLTKLKTKPKTEFQPENLSPHYYYLPFLSTLENPQEGSLVWKTDGIYNSQWKKNSLRLKEQQLIEFTKSGSLSLTFESSSDDFPMFFDLKTKPFIKSEHKPQNQISNKHKASGGTEKYFLTLLDVKIIFTFLREKRRDYLNVKTLYYLNHFFEQCVVFRRLCFAFIQKLQKSKRNQKIELNQLHICEEGNAFILSLQQNRNSKNSDQRFLKPFPPLLALTLPWCYDIQLKLWVPDYKQFWFSEFSTFFSNGCDSLNKNEIRIKEESCPSSLEKSGEIEKKIGLEPSLYLCDLEFQIEEKKNVYFSEKEIHTFWKHRYLRYKREVVVTDVKLPYPILSTFPKGLFYSRAEVGELIESRYVNQIRFDHLHSIQSKEEVFLIPTYLLISFLKEKEQEIKEKKPILWVLCFVSVLFLLFLIFIFFSFVFTSSEKEFD